MQSAFPVGLARYPQLKVLDLDNSGIQGPLPDLPEGSFPDLFALFCDDNRLSGPIPDSWQTINIFNEVSA